MNNSGPKSTCQNCHREFYGHGERHCAACESIFGAAPAPTQGVEEIRARAEVYAEKKSRENMERLIGFLGEDECDRERMELDRQSNKAYIKLGYVGGATSEQNRVEGLTAMNKHWVQQLKLCEAENAKLLSERQRLQAGLAEVRSIISKVANINPNHVDICATGEYAIMRAREALALLDELTKEEK